MSDPTQLEVVSQADTIRNLFKEATELAQDTRSRGRLAVEKAAECGALLTKEKARIEEQHGKGAWSKYVMDVLKIPESTARGWIKLSESVMLEQGIDSNMIRQGMLSLDIFPAKEHDAVPGDALITKKLSHLSLVNKFEQFRRAFDQSGRKLTKPEREQLKADFKPVVNFFREVGVI